MAARGPNLNFGERRLPLVTLQFPKAKFPAKTYPGVAGEYDIDPNLDVEDMGEAVVAEHAAAQIRRWQLGHDPLPEGEPAEVKAQIAAQGQVAKEYVMYLVRKLAPNAPDLPLSNDDVLYVMEAIAGKSPSVQDEVLEAVRLVTEEIERTNALAGVEGEPEASGAPPLASKRPSRKRSSRSGGRTSGGRTTGATSPGASSAPTSKTPAAA